MSVSKPPPDDEERRTAERRRRRAAVFGDVLPETTADDRDPEAAESEPVAGPGESAADAWLRRNVPPHHGSG